MRAALGGNLTAAYLHGSAVLGGFDPAISDLDVLVVCGDPLSNAEVDAICRRIERLELPAKGLEMSVLTRSEALLPDLDRPHFQVHAVVGADGVVRRVDGRAGVGDRDLILHLAVSRASGHALVGPQPDQILAALPEAVVRRAAIDEIEWARGAGSPVYLVLTAARARAFARTGRLVSKVEAGEEEGDLPIVRAALIAQRGGSATVDSVEAGAYADKVEADLRRDLRSRPMMSAPP
jgi:Aminoglycoside adenylyltransferase, C-terminal domain/Nucleotidyltransferase domain